MKVALVYGGGEGVFREAYEARELLALSGGEIVTIAVNDAGADPRAPAKLDHWCSLHPDRLVVRPWQWAEQRRSHGLSDGYTVWSTSKLHAVVDKVARRWAGGSSGLVAVDVAMRLEVDRVILCGVPMDDRHNEFRGVRWLPCEKFRPSWIRHAPDFGPRVRSMSGWTSQVFGVPTLRWLAEEPVPVPAGEYVRRDEATRQRGAA